MKFAYEDLSDDQFERLTVFLCQRLLGISVQGFAKGPDGGRDAKFVGTTERKEAEKKQKLLDAFDFRTHDKDRTKQLVDDIDERIATLNAERRGYLQEERSEIEAELKRVNTELSTVSKKRSDMLSFLSGTDVFSKYEQVSDDMVSFRASSITMGCSSRSTTAKKRTCWWSFAVTRNSACSPSSL